MDVAREILLNYGLIAVFLGGFFQGQTIIIVAGILASQGFYLPSEVLAYAVAGAWSGHITWFYAGRYIKNNRKPARLLSTPEKWSKIDKLIQDRPWSAVFFLQYAYGLRYIGALAFGFTEFSIQWFSFAQLVNTFIWAMLTVSLGFFMGATLLNSCLPCINGVFIIATLLVIFQLIQKYWSPFDIKSFKKFVKSMS